MFFRVQGLRFLRCRVASVWGVLGFEFVGLRVFWVEDLGFSGFRGFRASDF